MRYFIPMQSWLVEQFVGYILGLPYLLLQLRLPFDLQVAEVSDVIKPTLDLL